MSFDFPTIMVILVVLSGVVWAFDALFLARRRRAAARGVATPGRDTSGGRGAAGVEAPRLVEYARSFFPVFLIVLVLRSFIVEPFRIPSNSMMPTLLTGDFILVNKFDYGIRLPVSDTKVIGIGEPHRGDVVVFRYPEDPSIPFIKRVVGLPGDHIVWHDNSLYVNGHLQQQTAADTYVGHWSGRGMTGASLRIEHLGEGEHKILVQPGFPTVSGQIVVPPGQYFVMGDNRDNSRDSRYWGTVPEANLIGKAFLVWFNWDWGYGIDWSRIGMGID